MKNTIIILILLCGINCYAVLPPPPPIKDEDVQLQQYLKQLYDNHNVFTVISSSPNGSREGKASGEVVFVHIGSTIQIWVNQGGTVWVQH